MNIRYAKVDDLDFLIEGLEKNRVIKNRSKKYIKAKSSDIKEFKDAIKNNNVRVVEEYKNLVAFLYFKIDFKVMYIYDKFFWVDLIYVDENKRGKGLGKLLYKDAIKIAKEKGCKRIILDIFAANQNSINFHKTLEFKPIYTIYQKKI